MDAKDIKSVNDVFNYIEGCLNDLEEGISTKLETNKYLHELVAKVILMTKATKDRTSEPSKWISVEDRLPRIRQVVDIWLKSVNKRVCYITYDGDFGNTVTFWRHSPLDPNQE